MREDLLAAIHVTGVLLLSSDDPESEYVAMPRTFTTSHIRRQQCVPSGCDRLHWRIKSGIKMPQDALNPGAIVGSDRVPVRVAILTSILISPRRTVVASRQF